MKFVIAFAILCMATHPAEGKIDRVICYLGSWANYRHGNGKYTPEDIDVELCTHIIYAFLGIESSGTLKILDPWLDIDLKNLERFNALKRNNSNLKTLIAVGGWNEGSVKYSAVAADPAKRAALIKSAVNILETYGFDGFDLDWEYPAQRGGSQADKANFATLLKEFREVFDHKGYLLTAAVAAAPSSVDLSYDVPALSRYLDSINVLTYDIHGAFDGKTGANAPLFPSIVDKSPAAKSLSVDASIRGWISRGAAPHKISMGIPTYGRTFTLSNPSNKGMEALANGGGNPGPYTQESGTLGYLEICEKQMNEKWTVKWDNYTQTPYAYKGNQWVSYDDEKSIKMKVEHAKYLKLGGIMIWSLETDDFRGICGKKYPLLNTIRNVIQQTATGPEEKPTPQPKPTPRPTTPTKKPDNSSSVPNIPDANKLCQRYGFVRDPRDCHTFYNCIPVGSSFQMVKFVCGGDLYFDQVLQTCNYKHLIDCNIKNDGMDPAPKLHPKPNSKMTDGAKYCKHSGFVRDPRDCHTFYNCIQMGSSYKKVKFVCGKDLYFDSFLQICNYRHLVDCNIKH